MSWLRLDDGFTQHPKLAGWTPAQKWAWLEVLSYCARYQTGGRIPADLSLMPRSVTAALLGRAEHSGLIDRADDSGKVVHDWPIYNGSTVEEKVAYYLAKHPDSTANEVVKALGGTREIVLAEVKKQRESGTNPGSESGTAEPEHEPGQGGSESGSESGSRARGPVPSPTTNPEAVNQTSGVDVPPWPNDNDEPDIGPDPSTNGPGLSLEDITPELRRLP